MDKNRIKALFSLFTDEQYDDKYEPIIELAMMEAEKYLVQDIPETDPRPDFLCAAMAVYRLQLIRCSGDNAEYTYAGKMSASDRGRSIAYAERLLKEFSVLCRDIMKEEEFIFMGFSGKEKRDA